MSRNPLGAMTQIDLFADLDPDGVGSATPSTRMEVAERRPACPCLVPASPLSGDEMASRLEATGRYRVLRQIQPRPTGGAAAANTVPIARPVPVAREGERIGLILDTETTGLDRGPHEIIELGMVAFTNDEACLIPWFDGVILSMEWKEALWDKFVMAAPRPRTPFEQQYSDRKLRSRR